MADRVLGPSGGSRRRRSLALLSLTGLLTLALTLWFAIGAGAVSEESGFEDDDGNLVFNGGGDPATTFDWNSFAPTPWTGTAPNRRATDSGGGWEFDGIEDAQVSNSDNAFAGGTKQDEECASVITQKAPNKDDLKRVYFANGTVNGHVYLNLAWARIPQNTTSPSAHIAFEFNQSETDCAGPGDLVERSTDNGGDVLIVYDFEGGATDTPTIRLSRWVGTGPCEVAANDPPCWGPAQTLGPGVAEARVNTSTVGSVSDAIHPGAPPAQTLQLNEFGEAGIDLTDAGVFPAGECRSFGNAFAVSRTSGSSSTAQMKDLVGPGNVDIRNCGQIIINKVTDPSPDPTDTTFDYTTDGPDGPLDPATFDLKDGEEQDFGTEVQAGQYSVTEVDPTGDGFALSDITCTVTGGHGSTTATNLTGRTARINLEAEDTVECTFTNTLQQGAIMIEKRSTKGDPNPLVSTAGAVFSYDDGSSVTDNGAGDEDNTIGEVCVSGLTPGNYTVNETTPPPGYGGASETDLTATAVVGTNCTDNQPTGAGVVTFTNPPLADIQVRFKDGGSGETALADPPPDSLDCNNTTGADDPADTTGWDDTLTVTGVEIDPSPQTITCTIIIDP
jgi:hypothetical protein